MPLSLGCAPVNTGTDSLGCIQETWSIAQTISDDRTECAVCNHYGHDAIAQHQSVAHENRQRSRPPTPSGSGAIATQLIMAWVAPLPDLTGYTPPSSMRSWGRINARKIAKRIDGERTSLKPFAAPRDTDYETITVRVHSSGRASVAAKSSYTVHPADRFISCGRDLCMIDMICFLEATLPGYAAAARANRRPPQHGGVDHHVIHSLRKKAPALMGWSTAGPSCCRGSLPDVFAACWKLVTGKSGLPA